MLHHVKLYDEWCYTKLREAGMLHTAKLVDAPRDYREVPVEGLSGLFCAQHVDPAQVDVTTRPCDQHGPAATIEDR